MFDRTVTIGPELLGLLPVFDRGRRYTRQHLFEEILYFEGMEKE